MSTADRAASGEGAIVTALDWLATGVADRMIAAACEPPSEIAATCLAPTFGAAAHAVRSYGAAALALERVEPTSEPTSRQVHLEEVGEDHAPHAAADRRATFVHPSDAADEGATIPAAWRSSPRRRAPAGYGRHEGLGAVLAAIAFAEIAAGRLDEALVVGADAGRYYALRLFAAVTG
jgi:hypothetical protein